ncbi:hypothetical protein [Novosphingobium sp.]|uniref:hypothetical protein n=1 Tax=Novosphingobium sp. TaxID=1874826 RepID=UPI0025FEEA35|nr:hypothetical protein [Novosphingobium sp.]MCC6924306.1 hypothetical protein [Novosphingobium sp.]
MTDEQLADVLGGGPLPGSPNHEIIKFEMQRRVCLAQKQAADATLRGAIAAERYTRATWALIVITAASLIWQALEG